MTVEDKLARQFAIHYGYACAAMLTTQSARN